MKQEIWKCIPQYEDIYEISTEGRIKSIKTGLIRKPRLSFNKKYLMINLIKDAKQNHIGIHRLLAWAFIGEKKGFINQSQSDLAHRNELHNIHLLQYPY